MSVNVACMAICKSTVGFSNTVAEATPMSITCAPLTAFIYSVTAIPATMPMYPKKVVMVILSAIISPRMDIGLAPSALRMPNSCVRSFTVMSMMLLTPTIPLSKVKIPITQMAVRSRSLPVSCCRNCLNRFLIQMALRSSASNCFTFPMVALYSFSKASLFASVSMFWVRNTNEPTSSPLL